MLIPYFLLTHDNDEDDNDDDNEDEDQEEDDDEDDDNENEDDDWLECHHIGLFSQVISFSKDTVNYAK